MRRGRIVKRNLPKLHGIQISHNPEQHFALNFLSTENESFPRGPILFILPKHEAEFNERLTVQCTRHKKLYKEMHDNSVNGRGAAAKALSL